MHGKTCYMEWEKHQHEAKEEWIKPAAGESTLVVQRPGLSTKQSNYIILSQHSCNVMISTASGLNCGSGHVNM